MLNIVLLLIIALHFSPFGLELTDYANYDLYIVANLLIQFLLAGCLLSKAKGTIERILAVIILAASLFFLCDYVIEESYVLPLNNDVWIEYESRR